MELFLLLFITFFAAVLQAATGFGFGLVAVTFFLAVLQSSSVVQIVIIVTFVISLCHWWRVRSQVPLHIVKKIMIGCCMGYPIGIFLFNYISLVALKVAVALLILLMCMQNIFDRIKNHRASTQNHCPIQLGYCSCVGLISGIMTSTLAMPGPIVIAYLTRCSMIKNQVRATVITCSTASYGIVLILQATMVGLSKSTLNTALILLPAALLGAVTGDYIYRFINPPWFKNITLLVLIASGINILINL